MAVVSALVVTAILAFRQADEATPGNPLRPGHRDVGVPARIEAGGVAGGDDETAHRDTDVPDGLEADSKGRLIVTRQTRNLFEYFLASLPKADRQRQIARLNDHIIRTLTPAAPLARDEALDLARRFVSYMDAHDAMLKSYGFTSHPAMVTTADLPRIAGFLRKRSDMRREYLRYEVARIWYGDEEDREQRTLAALQTGESAQAEATSVPRAQALTQQFQALRAQGASPDALREFLRANVGEEAVRRFDLQRSADALWAGKYDSYRADAAAVTGHGGLDAAEVRRQLEAIRKQHFPSAADAARAAMQDANPAAPSLAAQGR
ncbi:lipase secretion chaperone [Cupriavidus sp. EM10]|nr:lipase secretion chaperone [Cupriavidus sp. EM10]QWE95197.1 hypothetical protein KLP38_04500 [Cupriavidus sp. EM10]